MTTFPPGAAGRAGSVLAAALVLLGSIALGAEGAGSPPASPADQSAERILIPPEKFKADTTHHSDALDGEDIESDRRFNFDAFRARALGLWFKRKAFLDKNLPDAAAEQTRALRELCSEVGVTRLDDVASALVHEGWDPLESTCRHASLSIL